MTWLRVASRLLRSDGPTLLYWEIGPRESGDFRLWLDSQGQVQSFQLTYARTASQPQYYAAWDQDRGLHLGIVDAGEQVVTGNRQIKMSPIIRTMQQPAPRTVSQLLDYFERNADELEPDQRALVRSIFITARDA